MPVFFLCFIVFIIWMRVKSKQSDKNETTWDNAFWNREQQANFVKKQDISHLDYITVPDHTLPFSDNPSVQEKELQDKVKDCMTKKMINLSGMSNTDIKITYGAANFPYLSMYDQNYLLFIRNLNTWGKYIFQDELESNERAKIIFEYAVSIGSDIRDTYVCLAKIYLQDQQVDKIQKLIDALQESNYFLKDNIIEQLTNILRSF